MKVLIYSTHVLWPFHYETELELIEKHQKQGDDVFHFVCNGEAPFCDANPTHEFKKCIDCISRQKMGQKLIGNLGETVSIKSGKNDRPGLIYKKDYTTKNELKEIMEDNFDIGMSVFSSLTHYTLDANPDFEVVKEDIYNLSKSALDLYYNTLDKIDELSPDLIYVFNGRFAHPRAVLRASQRRGVNCVIHERTSGDLSKYELFNNHLPHDIKYIDKQIQLAWDKDSNDRQEIGEKFFEEKAKGKDVGWRSFTKSQQAILPNNWSKEKINIAIFNSSENEFESIGAEWNNPVYKSQNEGLKKVVEAFESNEDYHFYLRVHPNLGGKISTQMTWIFENLPKFKNLTIIPADSDIGSYELLFNCDKVLTFGSSVGIEGSYWGKPVVQAGKSFWYYMDAVYTPQNHDDVVGLLLQEGLLPKSKIKAIMFGYYIASRGIKFENFIPNGIQDGKYRGVDIKLASSPKAKLFFWLSKQRLIWRLFSKTHKKFNENKSEVPKFLR